MDCFTVAETVSSNSRSLATAMPSDVLISWSTFTTPSNQERSSPIGPLLRIYHGFRWRHPSSPSQSEARVWAQGKQVIETYHDAG
ncbi:hypothetical protein HYE67_001562 [Fusarium culmorum]|uniref:Uncharacterized protein n=1 Tax=Fusarium culmorum TaxID=5516 RepID=A0A2T4GTX4_FUSCU|nr:hypothetical protein FCULG_00005706 [Fusarium culmorum]QPC59331.1 hypothetical protein HYE67_001562 [Fusarium culmorum]